MQEIVKLTTEESHKLDIFIGTCVRKNVAFSFKGNRMGHMAQVGIQEVYNASVDDIETYGEVIYKAMQGSGSGFKDRKKPMMIDNKIAASEVIECLHLIIQEKEAIKAEDKLAKEIKKLEDQLEGMKSESEIKDDIKKKLAVLKGESPASQVETPTPHVE